MDPGNGTHSGRTQTQAPRGVTVGTLKRGPPLRVRGDRGQPTGAPPLSPLLNRSNPDRPTPHLGPPPYPHPRPIM
eukprot:scaffold5089_cov127-Isochrysis_galbana.AAC.8